jgi:cobalt-zinc-cadmium efflux system protein
MVQRHPPDASHRAGPDLRRPTATPVVPRLRDGFTPAEARQARRLAIVTAIVGGFFILELGGALFADSVVLQADAMHLLMDVLALGVSLLAMRLAVRAPTARFTFGLRRAEPVAAIFSAFLVLLTTAWIVVEGVAALRGHPSPKAGPMLVVALAALFVSGLSAWLLHDVIGKAPADPHAGDSTESAHDHRSGRIEHGHALNLRGAALHLVGDTLGALAAVAAAMVVRFGGQPAADPVAGFAVAAILFVGSMRLLGEATMVLLEAAPARLPSLAVRGAIDAFPGVVAIDALHVWTLGAGHDAIMACVRTTSTDPMFAPRLSAHLRSATGAEYVTVQVEPPPDP